MHISKSQIVYGWPLAKACRHLTWDCTMMPLRAFFPVKCHFIVLGECDNIAFIWQSRPWSSWLALLLSIGGWQFWLLWARRRVCMMGSHQIIGRVGGCTCISWLVVSSTPRNRYYQRPPKTPYSNGKIKIAPNPTASRLQLSNKYLFRDFGVFGIMNLSAWSSAVASVETKATKMKIISTLRNDTPDNQDLWFPSMTKPYRFFKRRSGQCSRMSPLFGQDFCTKQTRNQS